MRVAIAQIDTTVGDFEGNSARIRAAHQRATRECADVVVFPELTLCGYPPLDLLARGDFVAATVRHLETLAASLRGTPAIVGTVRPSAPGSFRPLHNSAAVIVDGRIVAHRDKVLLPTYDVFDEDRYFEPGALQEPVAIRGTRVGIAICEDLWSGAGTEGGERYARDPGAELAESGAELIASPSASPYHRGKGALRERTLLGQAARLGLPIALCNLVGANTEVIFDGASAYFSPAGGVRRARTFVEDLLVVESDEAVEDDTPADAGAGTAAGARDARCDEEIELLADALEVGVRGYLDKCGLGRAIVGLSGGIDSAVTAAVAVAALGRDRVRGVGMPGPYSSEGSVRDARDLAAAVGIEFDLVPISRAYEVLVDALGEVEPRAGDSGAPGVAEQNVQARLRGLVLMALANREGAALLSTGNKSELAVGYCTLYGDMCGALAPLGDVVKGDVYRLARLPRYRGGIPSATLDKPPSAELAPGQLDADELPPYDLVDRVVEGYVEQGKIAAEIAQELRASAEQERVITALVARIEGAEHKRKQSPPILRVTPKAFGIGRRQPIARRPGWLS